ncbi:hypothetical protein F5Y18DRAFT_424818 [Xylariaceae sp. FL1019]|nr:hypothetical protein F5Y18DRAFT_424818 [Xylariaceae sp. FL1019]
MDALHDATDFSNLGDYCPYAKPSSPSYETPSELLVHQENPLVVLDTLLHNGDDPLKTRDYTQEKHQDTKIVDAALSLHQDPDHYLTGHVGRCTPIASQVHLSCHALSCQLEAPSEGSSAIPGNVNSIDDGLSVRPFEDLSPNLMQRAMKYQSIEQFPIDHSDIGFMPALDDLQHWPSLERETIVSSSHMYTSSQPVNSDDSDQVFIQTGGTQPYTSSDYWFAVGVHQERPSWQENVDLHSDKSLTSSTYRGTLSMNQYAASVDRNEPSYKLNFSGAPDTLSSTTHDSSAAQPFEPQDIGKKRRYHCIDSNCGFTAQGPKDVFRHLQSDKHRGFFTDEFPGERFYCTVAGCKYARKGFAREDNYMRHMASVHKNQNDGEKPRQKRRCKGSTTVEE